MSDLKVSEATTTTRPRHLLVTGGARSGKSSYAESLIERSGLSKVYIATGQAFDAEMRQRIERHQRDRGDGWTTIEEPIALSDVLLREARPDRAVLVDCLTLWLSNLMLEDRDTSDAAAQLGASLGFLRGPVVFVTNEVGQGIVPENPLARRFRDEAGRLNQHMASLCDRVVLVAAGQPVQIKPSLHPEIRL
ncbi:bifunctional adenosylcobinamide kinase/adenosylcobinamide-phosphate guanylyltransferase [Pseudovibrio exalbescens]|uniref:bifunctional adenosylcobinamide kinase/adenosylcobinamide-phosphate guanylyltransferase n=1 Tax=Pseudovibrio exalbescens TaxID=197461 RepID=UPI0023654EAE|nr:bifunctional adenosylcobinamide kinase/adenosylcobinamide-phosphate guanylyltransferase [Pseudovibrio exalbescens]MDD7908449.1 bifunctional adenosylcobinamide kinase/adenosylcobinamide-phosphate guanylyltransferase [Pseudovibrio exalbescens]